MGLDVASWLAEGVELALCGEVGIDGGCRNGGLRRCAASKGGGYKAGYEGGSLKQRRVRDDDYGVRLTTTTMAGWVSLRPR